jgi:hypothetical protein
MSADRFSRWVDALEARHLANLRVPEVTRALRALSSAYVERRQALARGAALDSAGKRAAFALVYAPIHFLVASHVVRALGAPVPRAIVDLGCGSGAAGAAWALEASPPARVTGLDRHPWAVAEARWTYRQLGIDGHARQGDAARFRAPRPDTGIVAAYVLNELADAPRETLLDVLVEAARRGSPVLILEPIARGVAPWWTAASRRIEEAGGRADEWTLDPALPSVVATLSRAAGLDHRQVKARSMFIARSR